MKNLTHDGKFHDVSVHVSVFAILKQQTFKQLRF